MADFEQLSGMVGATGRGAKPIEIDVSGATTATLFTPGANAVFAVRCFYFTNAHASADQQVQFVSDATGIWIATVAAGSSVQVGDGLGIVLMGLVDADPLKITTVGSGGPIEGGLMVDEVTLR